MPKKKIEKKQEKKLDLGIEAVLHQQLREADDEIFQQLQEADDEIFALQEELRRVRGRLDKALNREEALQATLTARTTALCALLELGDPRWVPSKEDLEDLT